MKANNNTLDKLANVFILCMVYNIIVKDKSYRVKRLLTRSKKKENGIVAVHLKSNKTAYIIFG